MKIVDDELEQLDKPKTDEVIVTTEKDMEKFVLMMLIEEAGRQLIEMEAKLKLAKVTLKFYADQDNEGYASKTLKEIE